MNTRSLPASALVDVLINIVWEKGGVSHEDRFFAQGVNTYRDLLPGSPLEMLLKNPNESGLRLAVGPGDLLAEYDPKKVSTLPWSRLGPGAKDLFKKGRFYPAGLFSSALPNVFKGNIQPMRCIDISDAGIRADLNHPMAEMEFLLEMSVESYHEKPEERGGSSNDWMHFALEGPGMQARYQNRATDFFTPGAFDRKDSAPDKVFYTKDRFVHHIDAKARQHLSRIYEQLLQPGDRVLDLMAGWGSHLPEKIRLKSVHGLGMNENELAGNPALSSHTIQDLNENPFLEFIDASFDAVICSLSIEYLDNPLPVYNEVARVLKPGGLFAVSFSNRWFPEKAIKIWEDLHEFERMGLVMEYFYRADMFESLSTVSIRGYPRPYDDKYASEQIFSDPVFLVTGKRRAG